MVNLYVATRVIFTSQSTWMNATFFWRDIVKICCDFVGIWFLYIIVNFSLRSGHVTSVGMFEFWHKEIVLTQLVYRLDTNEISMATQMFTEFSNLTKNLRITPDLSGNFEIYNGDQKTGKSSTCKIDSNAISTATQCLHESSNSVTQYCG